MKKLLALLTLIAAPAFAQETFTHAKAGFQVDVPAGWKAEPAEDTLTVEAADGSVSIAFMMIAAADLDAATAALEGELAKSVQELKMEGKAEPGDLNGLKTVTIDGTGKVDGTPVELGVALVKLPEHVVMVLGMQEEAGKTHEAAVEKIIGSMRAAK